MKNSYGKKSILFFVLLFLVIFIGAASTAKSVGADGQITSLLENKEFTYWYAQISPLLWLIISFFGLFFGIKGIQSKKQKLGSWIGTFLNGSALILTLYLIMLAIF